MPKEPGWTSSTQQVPIAKTGMLIRSPSRSVGPSSTPTSPEICSPGAAESSRRQAVQGMGHVWRLDPVTVKVTSEQAHCHDGLGTESTTVEWTFAPRRAHHVRSIMSRLTGAERARETVATRLRVLSVLAGSRPARTKRSHPSADRFPKDSMIQPLEAMSRGAISIASAEPRPRLLPLPPMHVQRALH